MITLYSKNHCMGCKMTVKKLESLGAVLDVHYRVVKIEYDIPAMDMLISKGYQQMPVVMTSWGEHWTGFRPERLEQVVKLELTGTAAELTAKFGVDADDLSDEDFDRRLYA